MSQRIPFAYVPGGKPNTKRYPFFIDEKLNRVIPPWFIKCGRSEAERLLSTNYPHQNVILMRISKSSPFAITSQTILKGETFLDHYNVQSNPTKGFYIEIKNQHGSTRTLSEIMEVFLKLNDSNAERRYSIYKIAPSMNQAAAPGHHHPVSRTTSLPSTKQETRPAVSRKEMPAKHLSSPNQSSVSNASENYLTPIYSDVYPGAVHGIGARVNGDYLTNDIATTEISGSNVRNIDGNDYLVTCDPVVRASDARSNGDYLTTNYSNDESTSANSETKDYQAEYCDVQGLTTDMSTMALPIYQRNPQMREPAGISKGIFKPKNRSKSLKQY